MKNGEIKTTQLVKKVHETDISAKNDSNSLSAAIEYIKQNQASMSTDLKHMEKRLQDETFDKNEIKANAQRMG